jgi:hypothetical protein
MDWARILAYVTGTVDQELLGRNEYLAAENPYGQKTETADKTSRLWRATSDTRSCSSCQRGWSIQ